MPISYQAQSPVLGLVLPSNSPGVHTLWLPIIPMQIGLVLKPGPQEPWTPYRMAEAFFQAGIPREAISIYPGEAKSAPPCLRSCDRSLMFGGTPTVERYRGNPKVQAHGPGLLEDPARRRRGRRVGEVPRRDGRQRVRQQRARLHQLLRHLGEPPHPRDRRGAGEAACGRSAAARRTTPRRAWRRSPSPGVAEAISQSIDADLKAPGVTDVTAKYRDGGRVVKDGRADYLLPTIVHCASADAAIAKKEYMFPFATVVECPQDAMLEAIGPTLVCSAITNDPTSAGSWSTPCTSTA